MVGWIQHLEKRLLPSFRRYITPTPGILSGRGGCQHPLLRRWNWIVRVGYIIFKKCPSLLLALVKLFNTCCAIKLIPKSSASGDNTNPANFRPIALTPCVGKLFSTLLRNRWLRFMVANSRQFTSEGFHANSAWLYRASSEAVVNLGRGPLQPRQCTPLTD